MPGLWPDVASVSADPAEAAEIADTAAGVRGAIATLADGQRHAVRLFYLQGLSHREVAAELGISVGAVKARLHQARAALTPKLVQYKLAAGLVEAAGSQITEVKITRLLGSVFYACVVVPGPGGLREVDARPSDAVNLAVVSGAPIRLNSELFSATAADAAEEPSSYPVATASIAAETE
jgi:bifunctional DNase/RNase